MPSSRGLADIEHRTGRDWDKISRRRASIEKAGKVLGYEPKMKMKDGIKRVYEWVLGNRDKIGKSARF